jgi:MoxR-like ATPase
MELKNKLMEKNLFTDILGQENAKQQLKSALLTGRHVIFFGPPGVGKTTLAKNLAKVMKTKSFVRIQGSPDLTAEDLLGDIDPIKALKYGPLSLEAFTKGKIFKADKGILFFDELNRCPEKLQNALLQVLAEKKATIGSYDIDFDIDFIFIGTMNPEDSSTEKISDVMLDRFDVIYMTYPEKSETEREILYTKGKKLDVEFPGDLIDLIVKFIRELREDDRIERKPSVRASLGLYERAQANAILKERKKVCFEDIKEAVISVLSHRISLKPSVKYLQDPREFIRDQFQRFADKEMEEKSGGCL